MNAHKKVLIGMMLSISCVAVGMYVNQRTSGSEKTSRFSENAAIQERYIETAFPQEQGNFYKAFDCCACQTPSYTLVMFTSLACQVCRDIHLNLLPKLQSSELYKSGKLRIVCVEYPADRVSFFASKYVWGEPISQAEQRRSILIRQQPKWTAPTSESEQLKVVEKLVGKNTPLSQNELKELFNKKMEAHKIFDIQDVPFLVVYQHDQPKGKRIKHRIGEIGDGALLQWIQTPAS